MARVGSALVLDLERMAMKEGGTIENIPFGLLGASSDVVG